MEQFIPCVTSANSARTGRSDQWPGLCRSEAVLAVLASTSLSVIKLALCKLSALASFAPPRVERLPLLVVAPLLAVYLPEKRN